LRLKTPFIPSLSFTPTLPSACHCGLPHQIRNPSQRCGSLHASTRCTVDRRLSRSCKVCLLAVPDVHGSAYLAFYFVLVRLTDGVPARLPLSASLSASFTASCSTSSLFKLLVLTYPSPCSPRSPSTRTRPAHHAPAPTRVHISHFCSRGHSGVDSGTCYADADHR
jgi:hypothetical protein